MLSVVVLADDFTGANGTGVLLKKKGLKVCTLLDREHITPLIVAEYDAVSFSTCSRSLPASEAYDLVCAAASRFGQTTVRMYAKRIDSTLRGNLGAETDALLDYLGPLSMAFVVPCFPSASRIHVGGYLLVSGVPLHRTDAANDPKNPIKTSRPQTLFEEQSRYPVGSISLAELMQNEGTLIGKLKAYQSAGIRTVIFDAVSETDLQQIAQLAVRSGIRFIAVDPGPFTAAAATAMIPATEPTTAEPNMAEPIAEYAGRAQKPTEIRPSGHNKPQILLAIGSVCDVARRQLEILQARHDVLTVTIQIGELVKGEDERRAEVTRVRNEIVANCGASQICCIVGCGIIPEQRVAFAPIAAGRCMSEDQLSASVNDSIAEMVDRILSSDCHFNALYTSGGDITVTVCRQLGAIGMKLVDEVLPLAAYGTLMQGKYDNMKMITKGGLAGNPDSLSVCVDYLLQR